MTIGEQLKRTRKTLGITQAQMCEGAISEAYYSRVERNINSIRINDLINILKHNDISIYDFFHSMDLVKNRSRIKPKDFAGMPLDIGKRLYLVRKALDINQTEMTAGVINASYYSRIETDVHQIRTKDLLQILNSNQISIVYFLTGFGKMDAENSIIENCLTRAFNQGNVNKLYQIIGDSSVKNQMIKQVAQLMIDRLENKPIDITSMLRSRLLRKNEWDDDSLWFLLSLIQIEPEHNFDELVDWAKHYYDRCLVIEMRTQKLLDQLKNEFFNKKQ